MTSQRQARRQRDREDFLRATTQAVQAADPKHASAYMGRIGENAGNTYRENLEDEIRKAVRVYNRCNREAHDLANEPGHAQNPPSWGDQGIEHKRKAARGYLRGLCKALIMYEDSYQKDNKELLIAVEREFLKEGER